MVLLVYKPNQLFSTRNWDRNVEPRPTPLKHQVWSLDGDHRCCLHWSRLGKLVLLWNSSMQRSILSCENIDQPCLSVHCSFWWFNFLCQRKAFFQCIFQGIFQGQHLFGCLQSQICSFTICSVQLLLCGLCQLTAKTFRLRPMTVKLLLQERDTFSITLASFTLWLAHGPVFPLQVMNIWCVWQVPMPMWFGFLSVWLGGELLARHRWTLRPHCRIST